MHHRKLRAMVQGLGHLAWICTLVVLIPRVTSLDSLGITLSLDLHNGFADELARALGLLASPEGILALAGVIAARLFMLGCHGDAWRLVFCMGGAELFALGLKAGLTPLWLFFHPSDTLFPHEGVTSTHTILAMCLFGFTAIWRANMDMEHGDDFRGGIPLACLALVLLTGLSRVYTGVHAISDVLWSVVLGFFWLWFAITCVRPRAGEHER